MDCPFCDHPITHKHGRTSKGSQRFKCAQCSKTFTDTFDTLYYRRQVEPDDVAMILQAHAEGTSLRGIGRVSQRTYTTVASIVHAASQKAQLVPNEEVQAVEVEAIIADEMWSFVNRNKSTVTLPNMTSETVGLA